MKKILFLFVLLLAVSAQAQEPAKAQQVKYTVKGVSKENGKMVYLEESVGEDVFKLMGEIKKVFDPDYILNPGKVCDSSLVS